MWYFHLCSLVPALCCLLRMVVILGAQSVSEATENELFPQILLLLFSYWCAKFCTSYLNNLKQARVHLEHTSTLLQHTHLDPCFISTYYLANFQSHCWFLIREWSSVGKGDSSSIWLRKLAFHSLPPFCHGDLKISGNWETVFVHSKAEFPWESQFFLFFFLNWISMFRSHLKEGMIVWNLGEILH